MQKDVDNNNVSSCPSFSAYCSDLQSAATKAVNDSSTELDEDEFGFAASVSVLRLEKSECVNREEDEYDFEFSSFRDEMFPEGEIGEVFPIFDGELVFNGVGVGEEKVEMSNTVEAKSLTLRKLFIDEDRESSSSSEADELDGVEPGSYCVWKPMSPAKESPGRCKKSKSTGSGLKRWKLRDLLVRRSNSDGKRSRLVPLIL
ncbi:hypothetical protein QQ045_002386 [Rhodiola kirilowii]